MCSLGYQAALLFSLTLKTSSAYAAGSPSIPNDRLAACAPKRTVTLDDVWRMWRVWSVLLSPYIPVDLFPVIYM